MITAALRRVCYLHQSEERTVVLRSDTSPPFNKCRYSVSKSAANSGCLGQYKVIAANHAVFRHRDCCNHLIVNAIRSYLFDSRYGEHHFRHVHNILLILSNLVRPKLIKQLQNLVDLPVYANRVQYQRDVLHTCLT